VQVESMGLLNLWEGKETELPLKGAFLVHVRLLYLCGKSTLHFHVIAFEYLILFQLLLFKEKLQERLKD
jgi:hypothetical protein